MKVALVYDRINKWGGAERILLLLHEMFPKAPVYTSVYDPIAAPWAKNLNIKTSFLEHIPYARRHHEFFALLMPAAFESFDLSQYDLVISLSSEAAKGVVTGSKTRHISICLTPTRYLWSEHKTYFPNLYVRSLFYPLIAGLRMWDKKAALRPDVHIAISKTVQERIKKYYKRDSKVMYPPMFLKSIEYPVLSIEDKPKNLKPKTSNLGYFLVVSRLSRFTPHKRVELAIKAANKLKLPLKVVGDGDLTHFKKMAGKTVEIVGKVTDSQLGEYYKNSTALIFPGVEDFGLVMVEAQSFGKPVIAYRAGGATEIIIEGKTGEFFDKPNSASLVNALKSFDKNRYNEKEIVKNAERFSIAAFKKEIMKHVQRKETSN